MDIKNILIIFDKNKFTKESIIEDIKSEEYKHNFLFYSDIESPKVMEYLGIVDEVWTFGNCDDIDAYKSAIVYGADIWKMQ